MYGLKPKVLTNILRETNSGGVFMSLLMLEDGSLIALAAEDRDKARNIAAIASSIWSSYEQPQDGDNLECLLIDNEDGRLGIMKASKTLICAGGTKVGFGILKAKVHALAEHLQLPLVQVLESNN